MSLITVNNFMLVIICIPMCQLFFEFTAHEEIKFLCSGLGVQDEHMTDQALNFYKVCHIFDQTHFKLAFIF